MEFIDNRPTYKLRMGFIGESYALEAGRRMGLPESVLKRADSLLDNESRMILGMQLRLENETAKAQLLQKELVIKMNELQEKDLQILNERNNLTREIEKLRNGQTEEFLKEIKEKELEVENLMRKAQEALLQSELSKGDKEKVVEDVKTAMKNIRLKTETELVEQDAGDIATPLVPGEPIEEGQILVVLERGGLFGSRGTVTRRNKGKGRVQLKIAGVELKMERHLLGIPLKKGLTEVFRASINNNDNNLAIDEKELSAKDKRMLQILREELVDPDKLSGGKKTIRESKLVGKRSSSNTLDIRGYSIVEAQAKTMEYLEKYYANDISENNAVIYVHHGNKKDGDIVKPKLRSWLKRNPLVRRLAPAELSDGGDAYTIVELQSDND